MNSKTTSFHLCGLDEAGRGAWAGPLVAAAVVAPQNLWRLVARQTAPLRDSKRLTQLQRQFWYQLILDHQIPSFTHQISPLQINNRGLSWANRQVFRRLIKKVKADQYLVDGNLHLGFIKGKAGRVSTRIKADSTHLSVILASIVAKVTRDRLMLNLHQKHPRYHWHTNVGYGTKKHFQAIQAHGLTRHHRTRFVTTAQRQATNQAQI
jgi:ribonuclease HII